MVMIIYKRNHYGGQAQSLRASFLYLIHSLMCLPIKKKKKKIIVTNNFFLLFFGYINFCSHWGLSLETSYKPSQPFTTRTRPQEPMIPLFIFLNLFLSFPFQW